MEWVGLLIQNKEFYFDLEDYDKIKNYYWYENDQGYTMTRINGKKIRMHRLILNPPDDLVVDHIFHNTLDNRKEFLRVCTKQQNIFNSKIRKTNKSGKTGVFFYKELQKWRSLITVDGKDICLGYFENKDKAIEIRKIAEEQYFGNYKYKGENENE